MCDIINYKRNEIFYPFFLSRVDEWLKKTEGQQRARARERGAMAGQTARHRRRQGLDRRQPRRQVLFSSFGPSGRASGCVNLLDQHLWPPRLIDSSTATTAAATVSAILIHGAQSAQLVLPTARNIVGSRRCTQTEMHC